MYCIDTNIIIDILRGDKELGSRLNNIINSGVDVFISPIMLCELYKGAYLSNNPEKKIEDIENFLIFFEILDLSVAACKEFGYQYTRLRKMGKTTQEIDLMTASIAKVNNLAVVTRNRKHFENIDVKIEVW